jgi:hypothetical protein
MNTVLYRLLVLSATMFAVGIALPTLISSVDFPAALWNILQIGGFLGFVVFGAAYQLTKPKKR